MKTIILYDSHHHGNTKKLVDAVSLYKTSVSEGMGKRNAGSAEMPDGEALLAICGLLAIYFR